MNELGIAAFFKTFLPGVFGAFVTILAKKKTTIKLACFATLEVFILLLIGGVVGWVGGKWAINHYDVEGEIDVYITRFFIGGFAFLIIKEVIESLPAIREQVPKILDAIRIKFIGN